MEYLKSKKAVIIYLLITVLAILSIVGIGFAYSNSIITYEVVQVGKNVPNLNYSLGTGDKNQATSSMIEAPVTTTTNLPNIWKEVISIEGEGSAPRGSENYAEDAVLTNINKALENISTKIGDDWGKDALNSNDTWNEMQDQEQSILVLYHFGNDDDKERATKMIYHYRPLEIESLDGTTVLNTFPSLAYGFVDHIKTNDNQTYKIELNPDAKWENGESVRAADLVFGLSHQLPSMYGSAAGYMVSDFSNLEGVSLSMKSDKEFDNTKSQVNFNNQRYYVNTQKNADTLGNVSVDDFNNNRGEYTANFKDQYSEINDTKNPNSLKYIADNATSKRELEDVMINYGLTPYARNMFQRVDDKDEVNDFLEPESSQLGKTYTYWSPVQDENGNVVEYEPLTMEVPTKPSVKYYDKTDDSASTTKDPSYVEFHLTAPSTSFPTMLSSQAYWPVNATWFYNKLGMPTDNNMMALGKSSDYILANGGFKIDRYDSIYGIDYSKNNQYWDSELVGVKKGSYRFVTEAATKVAMFKDGTASQIDGTSSAKILRDNSETNKWIKPKFSKPQTGYMNWNLGSDHIRDPKGESGTKAADYIKDPNFRRSLNYLFDLNAYHEKNGNDLTQPTDIYTAQGMYTDTEGNDFVDYAADTKYSYEGYEGENGEIPLENASVEERIEALSPDGTIKEDANYNLELAEHFWIEFVKDMQELDYRGAKTNGIEDKINLVYLQISSTGSSDPYAQALQQGINQVTADDKGNAPSSGIVFYNKYNDDGTVAPGAKPVKIQITPKNTTSSGFWSNYYSPNYDLSRAIWGPDYLDVWSFLGLFNNEDLRRNLNPTAGWTYWNGSDYTFAPGTYGEGKDEQARVLFNDGLSSLLDNTSKLTITNPGIGLTTDLEGIQKTFGDELARQYGEGFDLGTGSQAKEGIDHDAATDAIWSDPAKSVSAWLLLEMLLRDGAAGFTGYNETASANPSRLVWETNPVLGYETRLFAVDVTKIKKGNQVWYPVRKEMEELFTK